jgi:predicted PurR-regulated permease PerM
MPPRSAFPFLSRPSDARTAALQGLLIATIVIGALYAGREVLMPLALAILLSFVLTPPLLLLRRLKVPRGLAVASVVIFAFAFIFGLGWLLSRELGDLAEDLPSYRYTLSQKISALQQSTSKVIVLEQAGEVLSDLQKQINQPDVRSAPAEPKTGSEAQTPDDKPVTVQIRQPEPTPLERFGTIAGTLLPPLAIAGIVLLFVVFILLQREDLRDRLIRLLGASDLQRATSTINDAANRLSRYFLSQVLINFAYGTFIACAMWIIGMPSPIAWGVLAMLMRFVPYVGPYIAAALPLFVAAAVDPGWTTFLLVLVLYIASEMTMGQVVEPLVFGHGTGLSPLAVVISTVFWTWLWGPLGLILAMPITVCLAVLGRHVEDLEFFEILLSNEPALTPEQSFYHRALAGDAAEITYQAEVCLKDQSLQAYLDNVALPGLKLAERDAERNSLDEEQSQKIATTVEEMLDNLADFEPRNWFSKLREKVGNHKAEQEGEAGSGLAALEAAEVEEAEALPMLDKAELAPGWQGDEPVLCIGARSVLDKAAAEMLAGVLQKRGLGAEVLGPDALTAGHISSLARTEAKLVCLSFLGLGNGPAYIRYLVRRLRRILPQGTCIMVAYWGEGESGGDVKSLLATADADGYATSLGEALEFCLRAAKGELKSTSGAAAEPPSLPPVRELEKRAPVSRRKSPTVAA